MSVEPVALQREEDMQRGAGMPSPYRIERLATEEQLDALEREWGELTNESCGVPIYLTWDWIRTWWLYFGQGRQLWLLTARDRQGKLAGIAPLMREEYNKGPFRLGMLALMGSGRVCPTRLDILAGNADKAALYHKFLRFLASQTGQWDVLRIASVTPDSPEWSLMLAAGARVRTGSEAVCLFLPLPDSWDAFMKTVSRHTRYNMRSRSMKLEQDFPGAVKFSRVEEPAGLESAMGRLEELIRHRCHAQRIATDWDDPTFSAFHRAVAARMLERGWLRLYTLTVRDQIIAVVYNFRFQHRVYGYNAGFDMDWKGYSPGHLLLGYTIKKAIEESATELDMGRGAGDYKFSITHHARVEYELLFSANWQGQLWIALGNLERAIRKWAADPASRQAGKRLMADRPASSTEAGNEKPATGEAGAGKLHQNGEVLLPADLLHLQCDALGPEPDAEEEGSHVS